MTKEELMFYIKADAECKRSGYKNFWDFYHKLFDKNNELERDNLFLIEVCNILADYILSDDSDAKQSLSNLSIYFNATPDADARGQIKSALISDILKNLKNKIG